MNKILGIAALFIVIFLFTMSLSNEFLLAINLQNFLRWTAMFSLISIGVAFVIMTGGIDLSIGSVVALSACILSLMLLKSDYAAPTSSEGSLKVISVVDVQKLVVLDKATPALRADDRLLFDDAEGKQRFLTVQSSVSGEEGVRVTTKESPKRLADAKSTAISRKNFRWPLGVAVAFILVICAGLGLFHGILITKFQIQPFVVTLCTFLAYRGIARFITGDEQMGFKDRYDSIKHWAQGYTGSIPVPFINYIAQGGWSGHKLAPNGEPLLIDGKKVPIDWISWVQIPNPLIVMVIVAILAAILLNRTVFGRYLLALGANEQATRFSGIKTDRVKISAYVLCSVLAGLGGAFFAIDLNSISPSGMGNMYELYAIAGAVLGGCSLRGGEGNILGVIIGSAVMVLIRNSINLLGVPRELETVVIGGVILGGVMADELSRKFAAYRRARQQAAVASKT